MRFLASLTFAALLAQPIFAQVETGHISIHKGDAIPVTFDTEINVNSAHEGDRVETTVSDASYLPRGSHIDGFIKKVTKKVDDTPASLEISFDQIFLPDGSRVNITAVPVPLDKKYVQRNPDGKYVAKQTATRASTVLGGAVGGLIIGQLLHRPFEGAFIGTLAGIIVAEAGKDGQVLVIKKDSAAAAVFQKPVGFTINVADNGTYGSLPPSSFEIKVGSKEISFPPDAAPYYDNGVVMVPLRIAADKVNATYDSTNTAIYIENHDHSLRLEPGSSKIRLDGKFGDLPRALVNRNGTIYGPIDVLQKVTDQEISVNGTIVAKQS